MCDLCSEDEAVRFRERTNLYAEAALMREMARHLENLADGSMKPHTKEAKEGRYKAYRVVRYLVKEYV